MIINLMIISRSTGKIKHVTNSAVWNIEVDALQSASSSFTLDNLIADTEISSGDFVIGKLSGERNWPTSKRADGSYSAFYYGMVDSYEDRKLTCKSIRDLTNMNGIIYSSAEEGITSPISYGKMLLNRYVKSAGYQTEHIYVPANDIPGNWGGKSWTLVVDKPTSSNVLNILISLFKDVQVTTSIVGYTFTYGAVTFIFDVYQVSGELNLIADNTAMVHDFSAYVKPANYGVPNALYLQDAAKTHGDWDRFYLTQSGTVTQTLSSDVKQPIVPTSYLYDTTSMSDPKPSKQDTAISQLKMQGYQHEITMDVNINSVELTELTQLGKRINIISKGVKYQSIESGYKMSSDSYWITLSCGNIRTSLQTVLG